jgi:hypothetical protein
MRIQKHEEQVTGKIAAGTYGSGETNVGDIRNSKYKLIT